MNSIKSVLKVLCNNKSIRGALIITKDGMVIDSSLTGKLNADTIGAFMSQIALVIRNSLTNLGHTEFTRYIMQSNQSKVYLMDLGKSILIVITDIEADAGKINVALFQAANEMKKSGRLDI